MTNSMTADLGQTSLPLDVFRRVMGINPWHFWQMSVPEGCSDAYVHYRWIGDGGPGRYDFIQAMTMAEQQIAQKLDYWPGLRYDGNELVRLTVPRQPVLYNRTPMKLKTRWRHVSKVGYRTYTLVQDDLAVVYDATENVTMTIAMPAGTLASEVVICYTDTYHHIRPIAVTIANDVATIVVKKWLMADPDLWVSHDLIDASDNDNLLDAVDVYRMTYDSQQAILLAWEPDIQYCGCLSDSCVICSNATHLACAVRGDYINGLIGWQAAEYTSGAWASHVFPSSRWPDMAYVNYLHGADPQTDPYMSPYWAQIVSHFAVTFMDEAACGCSDVINSLRYWMEDLGFVKDTSHNLGPMDIDNPYGTRRGQLAAWKAVLMHVGD